MRGFGSDVVSVVRPTRGLIVGFPLLWHSVVYTVECLPLFYKVVVGTVKRCSLCGSFLLFVFRICLCHAVMSVPCVLVVTCWEGLTSWLSCVCVMFSCVLSLPHMVS